MVDCEYMGKCPTRGTVAKCARSVGVSAASLEALYFTYCKDGPGNFLCPTYYLLNKLGISPERVEKEMEGHF